MARAQGSKSHRGVARRQGSDGEDSMKSGSQSSGEDKVIQVAEQLKSQARGRREKRRTRIINAYRDKTKETEELMKLKLDEMMHKVTNRHRRRLERLQDLIRRRTAIESRMLVSVKNIENAFNFADKALSSALGRRNQALAISLEGLRTM